MGCYFGVKIDFETEVVTMFDLKEDFAVEQHRSGVEHDLNLIYSFGSTITGATIHHLKD